jgi:hypothetical protein
LAVTSTGGRLSWLTVANMFAGFLAVIAGIVVPNELVLAFGVGLLIGALAGIVLRWPPPKGKGTDA